MLEILLLLLIVALCAVSFVVYRRLQEIEAAMQTLDTMVQRLGITAQELVADGARLSASLNDIVAIQPADALKASVAEARVIEAWRAEMSAHPEGSPKHTAYANRLRSVGAS